MTTADVTVQWDDGNFSKYSLPCNKIRLFDNGPSGMISHKPSFYQHITNMCFYG